MIQFTCTLSHFRLRELCHSTPELFYGAWPDVNAVNDRWKPLLKPLYTFLSQQQVFYSQNICRQWVSLQQAVLQLFIENLSEQVKDSIVKVYSASQETLVQLPDHIHASLMEHGLLSSVRVTQPQYISQLIPKCLPQLTRSDRLNLLHYLIEQDMSLLVNQPLMPMADGVSFGTFQSRGSSTTLWCPDDLAQLFPGLEKELCDHEDLRHVAQSGSRVSLTMSTDKFVIR